MKKHMSASARKARDAILAKKATERLAQYRKDHPPESRAASQGPQYTCITCHPEEVKRLCSHRHSTPDPKGAYTCFWCGCSTGTPAFWFHAWLRNGEPVYEATCRPCSRQLYGRTDGTLGQHSPENCPLPVENRMPLAFLQKKYDVVRVKGVCLVKKRKEAKCTTAKPSPSTKSSGSSAKESTKSIPKPLK